MYVNLEEAISCPPPLFSTSSKAEEDENHIKAKKSAVSSVTDVKKSGLHGWCNRPTIHAFMDTVLSLSLRKKQQELIQQQIQEQEQKQKQEQLHILKQQLKQQKQQQFQQQSSPLYLFTENLQSEGPSKETISQSQSIPSDVHLLQEVSQRRPKVKKVMKGGILVTMPCGVRQQPTIGGKPNVENSNKVETNELPFSNYKDMTNNFGAGNILDDILARFKDGHCSTSSAFTKISQAEKTSDTVGDIAEISLGHESDNSSDSSGELRPITNITNTDFNPAIKTDKYEQLSEKSCGKPQRESLTSNDSGSDDERLSSFDRIRSLQLKNDNVLMAQKMDVDICKMTETKRWDDRGMLCQNTSMLVQTQSPEMMRIDEIKESKENDKKRKEILDETSNSIEKKEKIMKETKKNIGLVRIARSMSHHDCTEILPPTDTETQHSRAGKCIPRNNEPSMVVSGNVPSLVSMVSGEVLDVTVVEKELLRKRSSRGGTKKKRNKPTEWFLRKLAKEKELKNNTKPTEFIPPVCFYFSKGTCAKGSMCQFKHEKTKDLCGYYAGSGECYKFLDGMCPNLHSEFPCKFFHIQKFCRNEDNCRFSHAEPLTEEMRVILDNHVLTAQQRNKQGDTTALEPSSSITEKNEMNEEFKDISPVDMTSGRLMSTLTAPAPMNPVLKQLSSTSTTEHPGKSANPPRVKRLCSLSSYKPQILSSLTSTIILQSSKEKIISELNPKDAPQITQKADDHTELQFLPGIFKER